MGHEKRPCVKFRRKRSGKGRPTTVWALKNNILLVIVTLRLDGVEKGSNSWKKKGEEPVKNRRP